MCSEDSSLGIGFTWVFLQTDFDDYCEKGFLHDKIICSDFVLSDYSIPYIDTISMLFKEEHHESDYQLNLELWEYHKKNTNNAPISIRGEFKNINHCDSAFSEPNKYGRLFLSIKKPLKTKNLYYIQMDLNYLDNRNFIIIYIYLNHKLDFLGWFYERPYLYEDVD